MHIMMKSSQTFLLTALTILAMSTSIPLTLADEDRTAGTKPEFNKAKDDYSETYKNLNLFGDVFERVRSQYVEEKGDEELN